MNEDNKSRETGEIWKIGFLSLEDAQERAEKENQKLGYNQFITREVEGKFIIIKKDRKLY